MPRGIVLATDPMVSNARSSPHISLPAGSGRQADHGGSAPRREGPEAPQAWIETHRITALVVISLVAAVLLGLVSGTVSPIVPGSVMAALIGIALSFLHAEVAVRGSLGVFAILP
jgi:hypothetical protein